MNSPDPTTRFREILETPLFEDEPQWLRREIMVGHLARYIASDECVVEMARVLAGHVGPAFDDLLADKAEWIATHGVKDGVYHDISELRRDDLIEASGAILAHLTTKALEGLEP